MKNRVKVLTLFSILISLYFNSVFSQCTTPADPNPVNATVNVNCPDSAVLEVTGSTGDYQWFSDPGGNNLIGTGSTYTTGSLSVDTTLYVAAVGTGSGTGDTYNFTNAGATGNIGPSQVNVNNAYTGTTLDNDVTVLGDGIQEWVVPTTGTYFIECAGGQGYGPFGGRGAYMSGEFNLTAGDVLHIVVGQEAGPPVNSNNQYGGGGGSFVVMSPNTPLIIAGGGGGSWGNSHNATSDGNVIQDGSGGINGTNNAAGGINGNGGQSASSSDGGGGFNTNGAGGAGGFAFLNGALGGIDRGQGGFGGGGGTSSWDFRRSAGGGGYSGGGGSQQSSSTTGNPVGGGGGSFNNGANQNNTAGDNLGHGFVTIQDMQPTCLSNIIPIDVIVDPINSPVVNNPGPFCQPTTFELVASGSSGTYNWYSDAAGTNLIHTGDTLNTGQLSSTTTFYVEATSGSSAVEDTFLYTGNPELFEVPTGVNLLEIELWGAQGGMADSPGNNVNAGGYAFGELAVNPGDILNIYVGEQPAAEPGGWNGGGTGNTDSNTGAGGGGASDIRLNGNALGDRVIVAGGGGGHASNDGFGGEGGGLQGGDWTGWAAGGTGGTQAAGGVGGGGSGQNGVLGVGGDSGTTGTAGSGGGGGYYGGGGSGQRRGAGGGSGYIGGVNNGTLIGGENIGHGLAIISSPTGGTAACVSNLVPVELVYAPGDTVVAANDTTICEGTSAVITASGVDDYEWDNGLGVGQSFSVTPTTTTTYEVTGTAASSGCQSTDELTVFVEQAPDLTIDVQEPDCNDDETGSISIVSTGNGPFTYDWSSGETTSDLTNIGAGSYNVEVTDDNGCTTTENIIVNQPAPLDVQTDATDATCNSTDGSATANPSGGTGAYSYFWSPSGQTTQTATNLGPGIYEVSVVDDNGCITEALANVQASDAPQINLTSLEHVTCHGDSDGFIAVNITDGVPPYSLNWNPGTGGNTSQSNLAPGTYVLEVTDDTGCTNQEVFEIEEPNEISASTLSTPANCGLFDGEIRVNALGGTGNLTYNWNEAGVSGSNPVDLASGDYSVTIVDENGCETTLNETVGLIGGFDIEADPNFAEIQEGESVQINTTTSIPDSGLTYIWTPSGGLNCDDCPNPTASPNQNTTYVVTATFPDGCSASDSVYIDFLPPCGEVFVPTIFSPNNDGNNDELCVYGNCIESLNFDVYNRWGEKVFSSNDTGDCWNGNFKGRKVNSGVFTYKLNVILRDGSTIQKSGSVTLVR